VETKKTGKIGLFNLGGKMLCRKEKWSVCHRDVDPERGSPKSGTPVEVSPTCFLQCGKVELRGDLWW
jgi:hypothetical protein